MKIKCRCETGERNFGLLFYFLKGKNNGKQKSKGIIKYLSIVTQRIYPFSEGEISSVDHNKMYAE